ncbi:MAG: hypothetical protein Q8O19_02080 [Rectinemataceae bacterium]|nr:hypothetical protein [Rectinemataceae bacterium]
MSSCILSNVSKSDFDNSSSGIKDDIVGLVPHEATGVTDEVRQHGDDHAGVLRLLSWIQGSLEDLNFGALDDLVMSMNDLVEVSIDI